MTTNKNTPIATIILSVFLATQGLAEPRSITIGSETKPLKRYSAFAVTTDESARCLGCHSTRMPKLVEAWEKSSHAKNGVGCYECHQAEKWDITAKLGHFSFNVQLPVSPAKCGGCHQDQYNDFAASSHATAFDAIKFQPVMGNNPDFFQTSCISCHGSEVKMLKGKPMDFSWPNSGIGRVNLDGSKGSCASCHGYHNDSLAIARNPSTCIKCHETKFSPAASSYRASAHGMASELLVEDVDFRKKNINLIEDPLMKPTCQTCHMQASTKNTKATHNTSSRLSWKLSSLKAVHRKDWGTKRLEMQKSCKVCHASTQIEYYFRKLDAAVVASNHIVDKKVKDDDPYWQRIEMTNRMMAFRVSFAMLGCVDPMGLVNLAR